MKTGILRIFEKYEGMVEQAATGGASAGTNCWFEPLGFWNRCEETADQFENPLPTLSQCAEKCQAEPDCTSIVDYTWIDQTLGCAVETAGCTPSPIPTVVRMRRMLLASTGRCVATIRRPTRSTNSTISPGIKTAPSSPCRFVSIGDYMACENAVPRDQATVTGKTLEACLTAYEARGDCTAVEDYWSPTSDAECTLHLSSCDAPVSSLSSKEQTLSRLDKKSCAANP